MDIRKQVSRQFWLLLHLQSQRSSRQAKRENSMREMGAFENLSPFRDRENENHKIGDVAV